MIDMPDHGYVSYRIIPLDPSGVADGSLGGPSDIIQRPGYRYSVQFELPNLSMRDARVFQTLLEQASLEDASYPWPLEFRTQGAGAPLVDGSSAPGAVIPLKGLTPNYQFKVGQPVAVVLADGSGSIHRATDVATADSSGELTLPVFPWTRVTFANGSTVEVEKPRIRGILAWEGSSQGAVGVRPFSFTITERQ